MEMEGGPAKARGGRRRKTRVCLCATAAALIAVILLCLVLGLTVLKPKRPVTTVNSVSLSDLDVSLRGFGLSLNVSLAVDLSIRNPNKVGFKYRNSSALLYYRGDDVGEAPIPAGQISSGETLPLNLTLTVMADRFIANSRAFSDAVSDGILLLEINRMLRAGGYFAWAAQPVFKHEENLHQQWKEMENLTSRICWQLVKEGYIAIWQKPLNNSCYINRDIGAQPPLCDPKDDPDNVWYVNLKPCITRLPENGYGGNVSTWPERLHHPPDRLQSIEMDACISRKELFKAESKYWHEIIQGYVNAYHWKEVNSRNVMDMRAGFGGFAAAMLDLQIDCWVMNVVPVSGFNTLPVIYDRGLIGVMHDWCEPFDTYPRTYDLLHAAGLFSVEKKRCDVSTIMLEMDRILRPNGRVYIRDSITIMTELDEIAVAMGWTCVIQDTGEGPHSSWKILRCDKRM